MNSTLSRKQKNHIATFIRFSSYSVHRIGLEKPAEQVPLTSENSKVVAVYHVREVAEYSIETIGIDLEYHDAMMLLESRKTALMEFSGYRRVPIPACPPEPNKQREQRAEGWNRANTITCRLFMLPFITVAVLATLVILKKAGVL